MPLLDAKRERFSKYLSYLLRHDPASVGLTLDADGFVSLGLLLSAIRRKNEWSWITRTDLEEIQRGGDKRRFEIVGDEIRALYGHTLKPKVRHDVIVPPKVLFHGTARKNVQPILEKGILPMKRQYVHLSSSAEEAKNVGLRRDEQPVVLRVFAFEAYKNGVKFFQAGPVILSESIPPRFLELEGADMSIKPTASVS